MRKSILFIVIMTSCFSSEISQMQKACDRKMPTACYELGILHEKGLAVDKNITSAKEYYKKACDYGFDDGCKDLEKLEIKNLYKQ